MKQDSNRNIHWVGADVAKETFDAGLVRCNQHFPDTDLRDIPADTFPRTPEGVETFFRWLDAQGVDGEEVHFVMEATGKYSKDLAEWILDKRPALAPAIANPRYTSAFTKSMGLRNKTDRVDARALGFYGVERDPRAYEVPSPEQAELRALSRHRDTLVRQRTAMKNQMSEGSDSDFVQKMQAKRLRLIDGDINRTVTEMKKLVKKHENLKRDITLLTSIFGVAFIIAATIIAELGDLRRFTLARQLTAFAGMSPRQYQSGKSIHRQSRLCKQGNPHIRQCLYLSAMTAVRGDNQFSKTYKRLIADGKPKKVALIAIMRKLLIVMRAILINGKPYNPLGITS